MTNILGSSNIIASASLFFLFLYEWAEDEENKTLFPAMVISVRKTVPDSVFQSTRHNCGWYVTTTTTLQFLYQIDH